MIFNKPIQNLLLGFALCFFLWVGIGHNPTIAAPLTKAETMPQEKMQTPPESLNLQLEVDRYLTSIPSGYYTIANIAGLKSQLENPQTLLVDVRESSEYQLGHIPDAINIPLRTLAQNLDQVPHDRPVVLYCSSGYRAAMGVMTLHLLGYENVQGFPPSFAGWQAAGEAIALLSAH